MRNLRVFDLKTFEVADWGYAAPSDGCFLTLDADDDTFVTALASDGRWAIQRWGNGRCQSTVQLPEGRPVGMAPIGDRDAIAVGLSTGEIVELNLTSQLPDSVGQGLPLLSLQVSPDQELVVLLHETSTQLMTKQWDCLKVWPSTVPDDPAAQPSKGCISWRADGKFFAINYGAGDCRIYERTGQEHSRLDQNTLPGEEPLQFGTTCGWQPRLGGMISLVDSTNTVRLFERNGLRLRRTDFHTRRPVHHNRPVVETIWNANAELLAVVSSNFVQIFYRRNYHWYLKHQIDVPDGVAGWKWNSTAPLSSALYTLTGQLLFYRFVWVTNTSTTGDSVIAVVDGCDVLLTYLVRSMCPPPMCGKKISFEAPVVDLSFAKSGPSPDPSPNDDLIVILSNGKVFLSSEAAAICSFEKLPCDLRLPFLLLQDNAITWGVIKSAGVRFTDRLIVQPTFGTEDGRDLGCRVAWHDVASDGTVFLVSQENDIYTAPPGEPEIADNWPMQDTSLVMHGHILTLGSSSSHLLLLNSRGTLSLADCQRRRTTFQCEKVTSFDVSGEFVTATTRDHKLLVWEVLDTDHEIGFQKVEERAIDRGSLIVASLRDEPRIVLQAPRGNLEVVVPRPVVSRLITGYIHARNFKEALTLCRKHRINMKIISGSESINFATDCDEFVDQIVAPSQLALFIASLDHDELGSSSVNNICDSLVAAMKSKSIEINIQPIITAYLQKKPADYESVLKEVLCLQEERREEALDYLLMLVPDQEKIYQAALGSYDIRLAAMVAGQSQMDPAEYTPELRSLQELNENQRRFRIDDQLKRYALALGWLCASESPDALEYALQHELYREAIEAFSSSPDQKRIIGTAYGESRSKHGHFNEAGAIFVDCGNLEAASNAYMSALDWPTAALVAKRCYRASPENLVDFHEKLANAFINANRIIEAAAIRRNLMNQPAESLEILVNGQEWKAALESCSCDPNDSDDLVTFLGNAASEAAGELISDMLEAQQKIAERSQRLAKVRESKAELARTIEARERELGPDRNSEVFTESDASSHWGGSQLSSGSSLASDFTIASSRTSLTTIISDQAAARRQDKLEAKRAKRARNAKTRIYPGHPKEEDYLVESLRKLGPRADWLESTGWLLRILVLVGATPTARSLQSAILKCLGAMNDLTDDVSVPYRELVEAVEWQLNMLV